MQRTIKQIIGGITGAIILGGILGYALWMYGAKYGCFSFIDSLMQDQGYLSCGPFGMYLGVIIGALLGVILMGLTKNKNKSN